MLNIAGVYRIKSDATGKTYVGRAINIRKRWSRHRWELDRGTHRNRPLQEDWTRLGGNAFEFEVIVELPNLSGEALDQALADAEVEALAAIPLSMAYNLMEAGQLGLTASEETRQKLSVARKRAWSDEGYRERMSASHRAKHADPSYALPRAAAIKEAKNTSENKAAVQAHSLSLWSDPAHRAKQSDKRKANWQDPAYRAQQAASRKAAWADPEIRAKRSAAIKAAHARRRAAKTAADQAVKSPQDRS